MEDRQSRFEDSLMPHQHRFLSLITLFWEHCQIQNIPLVNDLQLFLVLIKAGAELCPPKPQLVFIDQSKIVNWIFENLDVSRISVLDFRFSRVPAQCCNTNHVDEGTRFCARYPLPDSRAQQLHQPSDLRVLLLLGDTRDKGCSEHQVTFQHFASF